MRRLIAFLASVGFAAVVLACVGNLPLNASGCPPLTASCPQPTFYNVVTGAIQVGGGSGFFSSSIPLYAPALISSGGTQFTISSCGANTLVGGSSAGTFAVTTTGTCVGIINGLPGFPNGGFCQVTDLTHAATTIVKASTTGNCIFTLATTNGDTLMFSVIGF